MKLGIVLEQEEDGAYSVHCPALKGCHSQGETREEALKNIQEAIQLYLEVANDENDMLNKKYGMSLEDLCKVLDKKTFLLKRKL